MSAFDPLRAYLESKAPFTAKELDFLEGLFVPRSLRRGEFLQRTGDPVRYAAFVAEGCLRSYVIDGNGEEVVLEFAPENWWLGDRTFLTGGTICKCFIDGVEHSKLLLFDQPSHQKMVESLPTFATMFRVAFQKYAAAKDQRNHQRIEHVGRGALPGVSEDISGDRGSSPSADDRFVPWRLARNAQPSSQT